MAEKLQDPDQQTRIVVVIGYAEQIPGFDPGRKYLPAGIMEHSAPGALRGVIRIPMVWITAAYFQMDHYLPAYTCSPMNKRLRSKVLKGSVFIYGFSFPGETDDGSKEENHHLFFPPTDMGNNRRKTLGFSQTYWGRYSRISV